MAICACILPTMIAPQASFAKKGARLVSTLPALRQINFDFSIYIYVGSKLPEHGQS